jgi:AraC-like DNA-binding protein
MQLSFHIFSTILVLGAMQGLFLTLLLFERKSNRPANRILALLILVYSSYIAESALEEMGIFSRIPHLVGLFEGLPFLFGPLHYLYARFLISPKLKFTKLEWLHFIPFGINRVYYLPYFFKSKHEILGFLQSIESNGPPLIAIMFTCAIIVQGLTYMALTLRLLKHYSQRIKDRFSSVNKINLNWLRNITMLTMCVWILVVIQYMFPVLGLVPFSDRVHPIQIATSIIIYVMGYLGLRQPEIFSPGVVAKSRDELHPSQLSAMAKDKITSDDSSSDGQEIVKYEKSGLSPEQAKMHLQDLLDLMNDAKPFVNSNLTLQELAEKLSITSHHLSQVINTLLKQSFFDFVNHYRVEAVKKALTDPEKKHYTLLAIAFDVGFNSKSSFNSIFKKHTNMTPSQYKQLLTKANS